MYPYNFKLLLFTSLLVAKISNSTFLLVNRLPVYYDYCKTAINVSLTIYISKVLI